ncbi:MAG: FAD-dependent oxidoreductase [Planctomycetota bacterium]|nr:FAD-dependent oxidoreductase [Planctomycetota bacterium]
MTAERFDVAIIGGGCAGLSLATRLAEADLSGRRVVVLEPRTSYTRDRTWCGWSFGTHRFSSCVDRSWRQWSVRHGGEEHVHTSVRHAYEHIPADRFYETALDAVDGASHVELRKGVRAERLEPLDGATRIESDQGPLLADLVVDTRPELHEPRGPALLQHFVGLEIVTAGDAFDPGRVTLMDFDVDQTDGIHFMYVLPFSRRRALVESTILSPTLLPEKVYAARATDYVQRVHDAEIEGIRQVEAGAIPMSDSRGARAGLPGVVRAGAAAGAVRPSTGYAFHGIQRQTDRLTRAIAAGRVPRERPVRSHVDSWLDRVFLGVISRFPERAPELFARMASSLDAETFARFMMERQGWPDRSRVVLSMPKLPFTREALRLARS